MTTRREAFFFFAAILAFAAQGSGTPPQGSETREFRSAWPAAVERIWAGPEYWANRLQDWRVRGGRLECTAAAADRNVHLLVRQAGPLAGDIRMIVRTAVPDSVREAKERNWVGFRIGARGEAGDYRDSAVSGKGLNAGLSTDGELFIGDFELLQSESVRRALRDSLKAGILLRFEAKPASGRASISLAVIDPATGSAVSSVEESGVDPGALSGNLALVSHLPNAAVEEGQAVSWFVDWTVEGEGVEGHDERAFGPVLFTQYTVGRGILKLTAQLPPLGSMDSQAIKLLIRKPSGDWMEQGDAPIDPDARSATFRVPGWDTTRDVPFRLVYEMAAELSSERRSFTYSGMVRREPADKKEFVLGALMGTSGPGFPHGEIVGQVKAQNPDLLFFSGGQIDARGVGYGIQNEPVESAILEYLRRWYLFGWAFGDLLRDRPAVIIPGDGDVFQGNLWGAGGKPTDPGWGVEAQDSGGYKMPPRWMNMVQRTQTSHLPDPVDPAPVEQGIGVYFGDLRYAGLSFAVLEDRKFKSAPKALLPDAAVRDGWARNPDWDPAKNSDVKGAELLGARQIAFLKSWAADWTGGTWMKVALSQVLFADVSTLPKGTAGGESASPLPPLTPGENPPDDVPAAGMDSNGWPPFGRNAAIRELRKAYALHLAGGQSPGSAIQYGIEAWKDAGFALGVPSLSSLKPQRWFPKAPGLNRKRGEPSHIGDFKDGFGNRMTILAVVNPSPSGQTTSELQGRAPGYGIVRFDRATREITLECWPRNAEPGKAGAKPYPGWPVKFSQFDNYGRAARAYLPTLKFVGMTAPVVQVVEEKTGEIVYTVRARGDSFRPKVFAAGMYTIRAGEPGTERWKILRKIAARLPGNPPVQRVVDFR